MIITDKCKEICSKIPLQQVLDLYSVKTHHDKTRCPLPGHKDKTASFKIYGLRGFHCFGCQQSGSVIDFVKLMDGITTPEAVNKLCFEFGLSPLDNSPPPKPTPEEIKYNKLAKRLEKMRDYLEELLCTDDVPDYLWEDPILSKHCANLQRKYQPLIDWRRANDDMIFNLTLKVKKHLLLLNQGYQDEPEVDNLAKKCGKIKRALEMHCKQEKLIS